MGHQENLLHSTLATEQRTDCGDRQVRQIERRKPVWQTCNSIHEGGE